MKIPCIGMDIEICPECDGLGRKKIKIYPAGTSWIDIMCDKEGLCVECEGKGWRVTHEWLHAELIGV